MLDDGAILHDVLDDVLDGVLEMGKMDTDAMRAVGTGGMTVETEFVLATATVVDDHVHGTGNMAD